MSSAGHDGHTLDVRYWLPPRFGMEHVVAAANRETSLLPPREATVDRNNIDGDGDCDGSSGSAADEVVVGETAD